MVDAIQQNVHAYKTIFIYRSGYSTYDGHRREKKSVHIVIENKIHTAKSKREQQTNLHTKKEKSFNCVQERCQAACFIFTHKLIPIIIYTLHICVLYSLALHKIAL